MEALKVNVEEFRQRLMLRKDELQKLLVSLEDKLDDPKSQDFSEHATESEFDEVYESQGREGLKEIAAIDAALDRISNDEFAICVACGNPISAERLDAVPHAAMCRNCMK
ncbi:MAG: TraR/DksA family transcriptional regulator [Rhizobiaceae bacterium]|nr:TraR/DksA family transcriptional regulator [Rhizobiaceae bacterium]